VRVCLLAAGKTEENIAQPLSMCAEVSREQGGLHCDIAPNGTPALYAKAVQDDKIHLSESKTKDNK